VELPVVNQLLLFLFIFIFFFHKDDKDKVVFRSNLFMELHNNMYSI
jgi:hypothetical protein